MNYLSLYNHGSLISEQSYLIRSGSIVETMEYKNLKEFLEIYVCKKETEKGYDIFCKQPEKEIYESSILQLSNFYFLFKNKTSPIFHCFENSKNKGNLFSLKFLSKNNTDIEISFSKDRVVLEYPDINYFSVFGLNEDGSGNFNDPLEQYQFTNKGFLSHNIAEKYFTCCFGEEIIDYNFLLKKNNMFNCPLIDICPTRITYSDKNFILSYDDCGLVTSCKYENEKKEYARNEFKEYIKDKNNILEIISIHPHLFDPFNYDFIDTPLKLWAMDHFTLISNSIVLMDRFIFEIDEKELDTLISYLNSDINISIISDFK